MYRVLEENPNYLFIEKLSQIPCITQGDSRGLSDELILEFPELSKISDFGFTHRLDNQTLGILLIARNEKYYDLIRELFKTKLIDKTYLAKVEGVFPTETGEINFPIAHSKSSKKKMIAVKPGYRVFRGQIQNASTKWEVIKTSINSTDLKLFTNTGRRHQIRVHLSGLGYPICGDNLYSKSFTNYPNLMLIAESLSFTCPIENKQLRFSSTITLDNMFNDLRR